MATRDQDVTHSGDAGPGVLVREGHYGTQVIAVEPGGAEFIPLDERHGKPIQLFWTWTSPNMERLSPLPHCPLPKPKRGLAVSCASRPTAR